MVACGALESPALLLRSGIGGPAVGDYLRLHPCTALFGTYGEDTERVLGRAARRAVDEFENVGDGYGFLIEGAQYTPGLTGSALPWTSGRRAQGDDDHGAATARASSRSLRDRGHGRVTIDANGEAVPVLRRSPTSSTSATCASAIEKIARLHEAAGAVQISSLAGGPAAVARAATTSRRSSSGRSAAPLRAGGSELFAPTRWAPAGWAPTRRRRVANPWGELHDTPGVWIGDGSAFPTPSGTNPMVSIMALAHRTAEAIAGIAASTPGAVARPS